MSKCIYFIRFLLLVFYSVLFAQEIPPITNYSPTDYHAANQNWSISQSIDKCIYVANTSGLLEYNGAYWKLYPSPNSSIMRSVKVVGDRIYTGCYREFGYWSKNIFGNLIYQSLSDKIEGTELEDEHFWNIIYFEDSVLFQSFHNIYIFNHEDDSYSIIESDTRLTKIFEVDGGIYYQKKGEGVYRIENGLSVLVSNHLIVKNEELVNIYFINEKLVFQTQESGFFFVNSGKLAKWEISANNIISNISIYSSIRMKDGNIILGTISNGIYLLDERGNILMHINQKKGLINNTVLSLYEDNENNIWLGLDNGLSILNFDAPFRVYNDVDGVIGSIYASVIFEENLYLGTNQGLFYKKDKSQENFKFIEGTKGQVWRLKVHDNTLFCGHNKGTFIINKNKAKLVADIHGTWDFIPILSNEDFLLQGHYDGLSILEKTKKGWQLRNHISGFDDSSRYIWINKENEIFVNHEHKGVFKLILNDNFSEVSEISKVVEFIKEESISSSINSSLIDFNRLMLYTSKDGIFIFDKQLNQFVIDSLFTTNLFGNDGYISGKLIANNLDNTLWGFTDQNIVFFSPGKLNNVYRSLKISLPVETRNFVTGYENVSKIKEDSYLFGTTGGYILLDLSRLSNKKYKIHLNTIEKSTNNGQILYVDLNQNSNFKNNENNVTFKYSVTQFDKYSKTYYQYQLDGIYNEWSEWTTSPEISFSNLPSGNYEFRVKAKIGNANSVNTEVFSFRINRPWFLSNLAIIGYSIILLLIIFVTHRGYKKYYSNQKIKLIEENNKKLEITKLEASQKLSRLNNKQLHRDIDNKNNELAIATMSLVKKNQLLRKIKNEISRIAENSNLKPVIKIINENLNNSNDWEFFKKAFNDADKDFFKKIQEIHPTLTPNDLKLCAYLRLNLNSKEIAPLLNISYRSVEIKRYRLRKKMDLAREKSLTEYILEF